MVTGLWGRKLGMTQVFSDQGVIPVTAIDVSQWFVTRVKTAAKDGYDAVQVARLKDKYVGETFAESWTKQPKQYFSFIKEVKLVQPDQNLTVGQPADFYTMLALGDKVDVSGKTKGCGFAGVVRRHNFSGAPASHGATMGKRTGSLSFMRSRGRVIKGKRMPGHLGNVLQMVKNLKVVRVEQDAKIVLVKGAVPGKAGSLVFVRKA